MQKSNSFPENRETNFFDGIMDHLTQTTGGNIHDNGTVLITSNSINGSDYNPKNVVDYYTSNCYCSKSEANTFVCFDFKERSVNLTAYSIKSSWGNPYGNHLKSWVVEVSNDGNSWVEVDNHENDPILNGYCATHVFRISNQTDKFNRFIRIRQTGKSWKNDYRFTLFCVEFYGHLKDETKETFFAPPSCPDFGLLRTLTKETNGNIHDNGTIQITSNSIHSSDYDPKNVVDYDNANGYCSKTDGSAFLVFDFKNRQVQLSGYSLQTCIDDPNGRHLKNWVVEVSNNKEDWEEIDRRENDPGINGSNVLHTFNVQKPKEEFHRFVRLRQIGNSWYSEDNHNQFQLLNVDFYGNIK